MKLSAFSLFVLFFQGSIQGLSTRGRRLDEEPTERECELDQSIKGDEGKVKFKCKVKSDDGTTEVKDEIKYTIETDSRSGLVIEVEYESEIETEEEETETETKYDVVFDRIVEYSKGIDSTSPAFDWETDTIVSEIPLDDWDEISPVQDSQDGTTSSFSVSSLGGVAIFTFTIHRASADEAVTANKMKIDLEVVGYPWIRTGTNLALLSRIESSRKVEVDFDGKKGLKGSRKATEVVIDFAEAIDGMEGVIPYGDFTWESEATILNSSNITIDVIATSPLDDNKLIAFSFVGEDAQGARDIYWDPDVGVAYRGAGVRKTTTILGSLGGAVLVAVIAALALVAFRRFRSNKL